MKIYAKDNPLSDLSLFKPFTENVLGVAVIFKHISKLLSQTLHRTLVVQVSLEKLVIFKSILFYSNTFIMLEKYKSYVITCKMKKLSTFMFTFDTKEKLRRVKFTCSCSITFKHDLLIH